MSHKHPESGKTRGPGVAEKDAEVGGGSRHRRAGRAENDAEVGGGEPKPSSAEG